tara:strand:+ start:3654 stop:4019 length:366 start_codon:yes stop_codon:yes gene_type:complete
MVTIYCIEDINDLKYIGSTEQKLHRRLTGHKQDKKKNKNCSSRHLNLEYCIIYSLETCDIENRKEREKYWINNIDCVNERKLNGRDDEKYKAYNKIYQQNLSEEKLEEKRKYNRDWCKKNR